MILLGAIAALSSCSREDRILRQPPSANDTLNTVQISGLNPGANLIPTPPNSNMYQESAYAVSEGQKLYEAYNCVGCHAHGGGGIGPPLMDRNWIYGSEPGNIFATIMQGRPNGMPSFRNRIPEYQAWEIAAYVRSMAGLLPKGVSPNRTDQMNVKPAESSTPEQIPTRNYRRPGATQVNVRTPSCRTSAGHRLQALDPGRHNMLHPAAPQAGHIEWLYWFIFWILFRGFCSDDRRLHRRWCESPRCSPAIRFPSSKKMKKETAARAGRLAPPSASPSLRCSSFLC